MPRNPKIETLPLLKLGPCPTCQKPAHETFRPFCSKRCQDLDLGQWLNESYRIETDDEAPFDPSGDEER